MARKKKDQPAPDPGCSYLLMMGTAINTLVHWHMMHSTGKDVSSLIAPDGIDDQPDIFVVSGKRAKEKFREIYAEEFNRDAAKELERVIFGKEQR